MGRHLNRFLGSHWKQSSLFKSMTITLNKPGWNCSINMLAAGGAVSVNKHTKDLRAEIHPNIRYGTKKKNQKKKTNTSRQRLFPHSLTPRWTSHGPSLCRLLLLNLFQPKDTRTDDSRCVQNLQGYVGAFVPFSERVCSESGFREVVTDSSRDPKALRKTAASNWNVEREKEPKQPSRHLLHWVGTWGFRSGVFKPTAFLKGMSFLNMIRTSDPTVDSPVKCIF